MSEAGKVKEIIWVGSSRKDLKSFPAEVRDVMGYALYQAQLGLKASSAKPLRGFGGAGVVEIVDDYDADTYRAVYTIKFMDLIYVLHAFQKKSKKGIETPKLDIDVVKRRLKVAAEDFKMRQAERRSGNEKKG